MGPFPISEADAERLRRGLAELAPTQAARVRARAERYGEGDDEPCPALDPDTGACELYAWRPITCRVFGPPVRSGSDAIGMCELCFEGASDEEIAACAVEIDPALMEQPEETTVARALTPSE
jgi:Fe-S-cluster containining protein